MRSNARVFPCGAVVQRATAWPVGPVYRAPAHHTVRGSLVRIRSSRRRPPPCAARDREEAPDGRGASGIETRGRARRRSPGRPARATPPPSRTRGRRAAGSVRPPAGSAGAHADTREHTVHQGASKAARAAASWSGGRPPGPGPRGNQCLVRAGPRSALRRGHARGPRPLASETKKRRKTRLIVRRPSGT